VQANTPRDDQLNVALAPRCMFVGETLIVTPGVAGSNTGEELL